MKKFLKEIYPYIVIVVVVVIIRTFFITPVVVDGPSMEDTLYDNELLLLNKISYKISNIERYSCNPRKRRENNKKSIWITR